MIYKMKPQDKTFELFRKNQHKLNERPSLHAWNKLERRLEQKERLTKQPKATFSIYRVMMMAAAAIALVFFVTTIANIAQEANGRKNAIVIHENAPTESLITTKLAAEQAFRVQYQEVLNKTVAEGKTTGRLKVSIKGVRPYLVPRKS